MSKKSRGKEKGGSAMPSDVSENKSPTESAMLEPDSLKIAGRGKPDEEGGELVIPAKATVGKNTIIDIKESIMRRVALNKPKGGKRRAEPDTAKRGMAELDKKHRKHKRAVTTLKIIQG